MGWMLPSRDAAAVLCCERGDSAVLLAGSQAWMRPHRGPCAAGMWGGPGGAASRAGFFFLFFFFFFPSFFLIYFFGGEGCPRFPASISLLRSWLEDGI